ncbi:MAG: ATP-grasp domain-containing protein [Bacteroidia bacterium]|nr:ATP-grasp domain-containing protein [Bacteroidia bacterium]
MNICILTVDNNNLSSSISKYEPVANPLPYLNEHNCEQHFISFDKSIEQLKTLLNKQFDVFLNLCDGANGENRPGLEIVRELEKAKVAFTGANSSCYEPSRLEMKNACIRAGINIPKGIIVNDISKMNYLLNELSFPMIVKHFNSYNSIGMTKDSVVNNKEELELQINKIVGLFGSAMVEEYISGYEFTALVVENPLFGNNPIVFNPMQIIFPKGESFKHFDLKWKSHISMKYTPVLNEKVSADIKKMSLNMFKTLQCTGYARCDIRMNAMGELYMLEINPNCSIYFPKEDPSSADEILFAEEKGHAIFTDLILKSAFNRRQLS